MADYTVIPDANLLPGKPIRSIDGLAMRDNPIAIAEKAPGAPHVLGTGIQKFTANGTFTPPAGVTTVWVTAGGGGGGLGGGFPFGPGGPGGDGGGVFKKHVAVVPLTPYAVVIGAGGIGSGVGTGGSGGATTFGGALVSCPGGGGGGAGSSDEGGPVQGAPGVTPYPRSIGPDYIEGIPSSGAGSKGNSLNANGLAGFMWIEY